MTEALIAIAAVIYLAGCIYAGWYVGTRMYSFPIGLLYFIGSLFVTPLISIPIARMNGGRF